MVLMPEKVIPAQLVRPVVLVELVEQVVLDLPV
jgi:hypothetical protein